MNTQTRQAQSATTEQTAERVGGSAGIEIVGFPQVLFTRTFGDPDMLFVSLLDASREAEKMLERLCSGGEERSNAISLSGMQLASSLLKDKRFSLVASGLSHENAYRIDLGAGTLSAVTRLYAVVNRRTSFFKVEIAGKIAGGPFAVRNLLKVAALTEVAEDRVRQRNFFSSTLAQECLRAQMEQERFGKLEDPNQSAVNTEIRLLLSVGDNKIPVALRQKERGGSWDIIDGRNREFAGKLPAENEAQLRGVTSFLQDLFV
jgi:hypothetical protein